MSDREPEGGEWDRDWQRTGQWAYFTTGCLAVAGLSIAAVVTVSARPPLAVALVLSALLLVAGASGERMTMKLCRPQSEGDGVRLIIRSGASDDSRQALASLRIQSQEIPRRIGLQHLILTADAKGLEVWGGLLTPNRWVNIDWSSVRKLEPRLVNRRNGLSITFESGNHVVELPFIVNGRGPFGAFVEDRDNVGRVVEQLENLRAGRSKPQ